MSHVSLLVNYKFNIGNLVSGVLSGNGNGNGNGNGEDNKGINAIYVGTDTGFFPQCAVYKFGLSAMGILSKTTKEHDTFYQLPAFQLINPNHVSVSFWIYPTTWVLSSDGDICIFNLFGNGYHGFLVKRTATNDTDYYFGDSEVVCLNPGKWYHIVCTFSRFTKYNEMYGCLNIYVDNIFHHSVKTTPNYGFPTLTDYSRIGSVCPKHPDIDIERDDDFFDNNVAYLDEFYLFNCLLDDSMRFQLFHNIYS